MSAKEHISSSAAMSTMMGSDGIYQSLFRKIHLTVAIHTPLSCLAKSAEDVVMHQPDVQHVNPKIMMRCQNAMMMSQREMLTLNAVLVQLRQMVRGVCREPGIAQRG